MVYAPVVSAPLVGAPMVSAPLVSTQLVSAPLVSAPPTNRVSETPMTASSVAASVAPQAPAAARTRTGGPQEDGPKILEHLMGWTLVVVLAMFVTQAGLM